MASNGKENSTRIPFPQTPEEFEQDVRVSYDKRLEKWTLEEEDGTEWEFNQAAQRWMPSLDESLLEKQREAYAVPGVDENEPTKAASKTKRKNSEDDSGAKAKRTKSNEPSEPKQTSAVYVQNIPLDATFEEVNSVFARYGVIAEDLTTGGPRIKLYKNEAGKLKGDAFIQYHRPESVQLAIDMLDDTDFRLGKSQQAKLRVQMADASFKKEKEPNVSGQKAAAHTSRKKILKSKEKLNSKLADWSDDEPSVMAQTSSRFDKILYLKHMFTLQELEEDATAAEEIRDDIKGECQKHGEVIRVTLYDLEEQGVVSVQFKNPQAAEACLRAMEGRHFGGNAVEAFIATGKENFRKTPGKMKHSHEGDEKRMEEFGEWLMAHGGDEENDKQPGGGEEVR